MQDAAQLLCKELAAAAAKPPGLSRFHGSEAVVGMKM